MTCEQAKQSDMVSYLSTLGYEPSKIKGNDYWYLSPIRAEKTPSFKVNRKLNVWYDHGEGKGGSLIDFAILYHECTVADFLKILDGNPSNGRQNINPSPVKEVPEPKIEILSEKKIFSSELLNYLNERKIDITIADAHCCEVIYRFNSENYFAIGFKNDKGGFELRNKYFKGCSSPKGPTLIKNSADVLCVFEGFFDFLSYLTMTKIMDVPAQDFLILNSLSFVESCMPVLADYSGVRLFVDNDNAGQKAALYLCSLDEKISDESKGYRNYKDLNDFLNNKRK